MELKRIGSSQARGRLSWCRWYRLRGILLLCLVQRNRWRWITWVRVQRRNRKRKGKPAQLQLQSLIPKKKPTKSAKNIIYTHSQCQSQSTLAFVPSQSTLTLDPDQVQVRPPTHAHPHLKEVGKPMWRLWIVQGRTTSKFAEAVSLALEKVNSRW